MKKEDIKIGNKYVSLGYGEIPTVTEVKALNFVENTNRETGEEIIFVKVSNETDDGFWTYTLPLDDIFKTEEEALSSRRNIDQKEQTNYANNIKTINDLLYFCVFANISVDYNARKVIIDKMKEFKLDTEKIEQTIALGEYKIKRVKAVTTSGKYHYVSTNSH